MILSGMLKLLPKRFVIWKTDCPQVPCTCAQFSMRRGGGGVAIAVPLPPSSPTILRTCIEPWWRYLQGDTCLNNLYAFCTNKCWARIRKGKQMEYEKNWNLLNLHIPQFIRGDQGSPCVHTCARFICIHCAFTAYIKLPRAVATFTYYSGTILQSTPLVQWDPYQKLRFDLWPALQSTKETMKMAATRITKNHLIAKAIDLLWNDRCGIKAVKSSCPCSNPFVIFTLINVHSFPLARYRNFQYRKRKCTLPAVKTPAMDWITAKPWHQIHSHFFS